MTGRLAEPQPPRSLRPEDPLPVRERLAALLALPEVGVEIRDARLFGHGSSAGVEIALSNGEVLAFETVRDMTRPANLIAEVVACTGAIPKIKQHDAMRAVKLLRTLAQRERVFSDREVATECGTTYLGTAVVLDVDMSDQRKRWRAFEHLEHNDVVERCRREGRSIAAVSIVLRDVDGTRLVRAGWFYSWVRTQDPSVSQQALGRRMTRVGWSRRGNEGRIKATAPGRPGHRSWNFWAVAAEWEEQC